MTDKPENQARASTAPEDNTVPSAPLWKKVFKVALYVSSALVAPVSLRRGSLWPRLSLGKMAIFFGTPLLVMPMAANLFPTAEEVLAQKGYPAAMVGDLAPDRGNIRVLPDNAWGHAHAFFSTPVLSTLSGRNGVWNRLRDDRILGFARQGQGWVPDIIHVKDMPDISDNRDAISREDKWLHTFLHEVRHVSHANHVLGEVLAQESDSDYEAARVLIAHLDRPDFRDQLMAYKGGAFPETHDTALYLSARFNGTAAPSVQEMAAANQEAWQLMEVLQSKESLGLIAALGCHLQEKAGRPPCHYTFNGQPLSDLARQRLGLYFNHIIERAGAAEKSEPLPQERAPAPLRPVS